MLGAVSKKNWFKYPLTLKVTNLVGKVKFK